MRDHEFFFSGELAVRAFFVYVYKIYADNKQIYYYVGRTGDNKPMQVGTPLNRIAQHLSDNINASALKRNMLEAGLDPQKSKFRYHCFGPYHPFPNTDEEHIFRRDYVSTIEFRLVKKLKANGYNVIGKHAMRSPFEDKEILDEIDRLYQVITRGR